MSNLHLIIINTNRELLTLFPYTHICFARDILGKLSNEIVLGAIFPDTVIAGFLNHSDTHHNSRAIHSYFKRIGVFNDFSLAVITHGTDLKGMDYFCDEKYKEYEKGFAFEMARPLVDKVVNQCGIPENMGWWKAHNYIEMASELWFYKNRPEYRGLLEQALSDTELIITLSQMLSPFFDLSTAKIAMSFAIYGEYVLMDEITPLELARKYQKQTLKKHGLHLDIQASASVIEEGLEIVNRSLPVFLEACKQEVKSVVQTLNNSNKP